MRYNRQAYREKHVKSLIYRTRSGFIGIFSNQRELLDKRIQGFGCTANVNPHFSSQGSVYNMAFLLIHVYAHICLSSSTQNEVNSRIRFDNIRNLANLECICRILKWLLHHSLWEVTKIPIVSVRWAVWVFRCELSELLHRSIDLTLILTQDIYRILFGAGYVFLGGNKNR